MKAKNLEETRRGFSVDEIAHMYHLSRQKVYDEINSGRLGSIKVGARRICTLAHIEQWEKEAAA